VYLCVLETFLRGTAAALYEAVRSRLHNEQLTAELELACTQLAEAVETAKSADRSKSRFLANMSHEIRTPMNAVLGLATALLDETIAPDHRRSIETIHDSADILLRLINEILDFSQIEAGRVKLEAVPFSPRKLVRDTVDLIRARAAEKGLAVRTGWDDRIPETLRGDEGRIRQVLVNLAGNAVKFTEQGQIVVSVQVLDRTEADVTLAWRVSDTGIGISPVALQALFQDFSQADETISRRYGGTGLGLAISRRLVEMMGGTIEAQSSPGAGSVFSFRLTLPVAASPPVVEDVTGASDDALRDALTALGRRMRVLLAEDNPTNQFVVHQMLKGFAIDVDVAGNGREAVERACASHYDLIYMDMRMPEMDGPEAAREIRRRGISTPIVAFTANAFEEDVRACRSAGMDDFITKPVRKAVFVGTTCKAVKQVPSFTRSSAVGPSR
jgi:signal transduction histidine kinase